MTRALRGTALAVALSVATPGALAQSGDESAPGAETRRLAAEHFDRGIAFFNEERYDAALAELARAYELAPAHQVLYNLARVHAALGNAVESARAYSSYLEDAGASIGRARRREAERALAEQRSRIGRLTVTADVPRATISVDGVDVATTPLTEPIELSAGSHTVEVRAPGREPVRRAVSIAGNTDQTLDLRLERESIPRGNLRVTANLADVRIEVDEEPVGITPLQSSVPLVAGTHQVRASRAGYLEETRAVIVEEGAEAEVHFDLRRSPQPPPEHVGRMRMRLPSAPYILHVDGEALVGDNHELPIGAHAITVEVSDRQPYRGTIRVPAGTSVLIVPPLSWTLEARRSQLESARAQHDAGLITFVAGAVVAAASFAVVGVNEDEIARTDARVIQIMAELPTCSITMNCEELEDEGERLQSAQQTQDILRGVFIPTAVVATLATGIGLAVWLSAPSEADIDAAARAELRLRPGGVELRGQF